MTYSYKYRLSLETAPYIPLTSRGEKAIPFALLSGHLKTSTDMEFCCELKNDFKLENTPALRILTPQVNSYFEDLFSYPCEKPGFNDSVSAGAFPTPMRKFCHPRGQEGPVPRTTVLEGRRKVHYP